MCVNVRLVTDYRLKDCIPVKLAVSRLHEETNIIAAYVPPILW
jgi:hypothetical protein